jgi:hypothetical protein
MENFVANVQIRLYLLFVTLDMSVHIVLICFVMGDKHKYIFCGQFRLSVTCSDINFGL